jgi:hypothetical protein
VASLDSAPQRSFEEKKYHLLKKYTPKGKKKKKQQARINIANHNPATCMINSSNNKMNLLH